MGKMYVDWGLFSKKGLDLSARKMYDYPAMRLVMAPRNDRFRSRMTQFGKAELLVHISQSANQPISQSANQPISQSANQPIVHLLQVTVSTI